MTHVPPSPHPAPAGRSGLGVPCVLVALLTASAEACKSPDEFRADADREVYEIIKERREELAAGGAFTIDPPTDTLRDRLLEGEAGPQIFDLIACLDVAAENSRDYQTEREILYLTSLDLTLERWEFSVQETGTFGAFLSGQGNEAQDTGLLSNFGLSKLFMTGLSVVGNVGLDLVRDVSTGDGWDAVSNLSLNITQPFLRGFGEDIVGEPLTQAEQDVLYAARDYERFRRTFAFDVASRFFRILQQEDTLENEKQNHASLTTLRERNEAFEEAGLQSDIQVDQARQDELRAESRVIDARRRLLSLRDDFKFFLGLPIETELALDRGDYLDIERWEALQYEFDEAQVAAIALRERLDYKTDLDRVIDAQRKINVAADDLRAGLDFVAVGEATSVEGRPFDYNGNDFDWTLSLNFDAPVNLLPERNVYRASLIALDVAQRQAMASADDIVRDVRDELRLLIAAEENYEIQRGAVVLAERRVESSELNLEAGRADTRDVLESQEALIQARNAAVAALTEYILAGLALYRDMELIRVTADGIDVDTAPLEEETP